MEGGHLIPGEMVTPLQSPVLARLNSSRRSFESWLMSFLHLGLCHRRQWPQPHYETYASRAGVKCVVRVNNREYHTDTTYENQILAEENAAMRAYLICRNFSVNDGRYPSGHNKSGVLQGMPVAIGTERRSFYTEDTESSSSSGGSSPRSYEAPRVYGNDRRASGASRVVSYGGSRRR